MIKNNAGQTDRIERTGGAVNPYAWNNFLNNTNDACNNETVALRINRAAGCSSVKMGERTSSRPVDVNFRETLGPAKCRG